VLLLKEDLIKIENLSKFMNIESLKYSEYFRKNVHSCQCSKERKLGKVGTYEQ
jgi:hypothetical protein